jgi:hypothetical protein
MMWIAHKAKEGDTLESIAKAYKNKDSKAILQYHRNKKVSKRLQKGEALKKGEVVWVLNPKSKVYTVSDGKCSMILEECAYKATVKEVHRVMDRVLEMQRINYDAACARHDAQIDINKDQAFIAFVAETFNSHDEPLSQWRKAKAAYKKLGSVVKGRDYKGFKKAAVDCELAVSQYANDVRLWVHGLVDVIDTTTSGMKFLRGAGEFALFALIVTAAAPASLAAGVAISAGASATTGLVFDGYENLGRMAAGVETMSYSEIGTRMMTNAITGAAGALIAGKLIQKAGPHVAKAVTQSGFLTKWAQKVGTQMPKSMLEAERKIAVKKLTQKYGDDKLMIILKEPVEKELQILAAQKFVLRISHGAVMKSIYSHFGVSKMIYDWIQSKPKDLQGKDEKKIGSAAAKHLLDNGAGQQILDDYMKKNMKAYRATLQSVIIADAEARLKEAA